MWIGGCFAVRPVVRKQNWQLVVKLAITSVLSRAARRTGQQLWNIRGKIWEKAESSDGKVEGWVGWMEPKRTDGECLEARFGA